MAIDQRNGQGQICRFGKRRTKSPRCTRYAKTRRLMSASSARASPGLSVAYELSHAGQKVIVLDDGAIGRGMTARTTAHLVNALDDRYYDLEKYHGEDGARMAAQSHSAAIDRVEKIATRKRSTAISSGWTVTCSSRLMSRSRIWRKNSMPACEPEFRWNGSRRRRSKDFDTHRAIRFPRQAQIHPLKYLRGLAEAVTRRGGQIFTGTKVEEALVGKTRASRPRIN